MEASPGVRRRDRVVILGSIALVAMVAMFGVVFAQSDQAARVAGEALVLESSESTLTAAARLRANLGIALVITSAEAAGIDTAEPAAVALADADRSADAFEAEAGAFARAMDDPDLEVAVAAVTAGSRNATDLAASGKVAEADALARETVVPELEDVEGVVRRYGDEAGTVIRLAGTSAGDLARTASFGVALVVPAIAVLVVRSALRRRTERQLLDAELAAERETAAARDDLIASLSHQLRTPLAGVYGFAETVRDMAHDDALKRDFMIEAADVMFAEAFELRRMIDDLLVVARKDSGSLTRSVGPVDIVRAVEAAVDPFSKAGIAPLVDLRPGTVLADDLRLQHIVRNLVHNAAKHGGDNLALIGRREGGVYRLSVVDDGSGLVDGPIERYRAPYVHAGVQATVTGSIGLGLSVAHSLAETMDASLVHRRIENTTWFEIELNVAVTAAEALQTSRR